MCTEINFNIFDNGIVGVQDSADNPGKFLIFNLIAANKTDCHIHIFCYDQFYKILEDDFNGLHIIDSSNPNSSDVHFHDCLSYRDSSDPLCEFLSTLNTAGSVNRLKIIVVIDSLSTLLLLRDLNEIYSTLSRALLRKKELPFGAFQIFALIHEDTLVNRDHTLRTLKNLCKAWVKVEQDSLNVAVKKPSGKLHLQSYIYKSTEKIFEITKKNDNLRTQKCSNEKGDLPISTFKLDLSENERKARDAVQLPYEKDNSQSNVMKGGEIIYIPDEHDDWDEEDPDNDLEFSS